MLYNSYAFVLVYLPAVLALHFGVFARLGMRWALGWLATASLAFYAYWRPPYVLLIVASMLINYGIGRALSASYREQAGVGRAWNGRRWLATGAVAANLALLGYFKYVHFFSEAVSAVLSVHWVVSQVILPLGISFFTFEQVGYVVDAYRGEARAYSFVEYFFFVTFFPHLIAGPIIVHSELLSQVADPKRYRFSADNMACGLSLFVFGLAKKVLLADSLASMGGDAFARAQAGEAAGLAAAWLGLLAYALQLYFDFSGYSDMGLGLARMLNFKLPLNFDSPYKAANIIDFWRRWHMTLSRFLRDMLYIPLGGNRFGLVRRHINLTTTMLLGGLWHGAGWNFLVWGGLHGLYLVINHTWQAYARAHFGSWRPGPLYRQAAILLTFLAVLVGWVFFRAASAGAAVTFLAGLVGGGGVESATELAPLLPGLAACALGYLVVRLCPNTQEILAPFEPAVPAIKTAFATPWSWRPRWALAAAALAAASMLGFTHVSEFLYFQF